MRRAPQPPERLVVMGRIAAPFGVKGWLKIQPFTAEPDALSRYPVWWVSEKNAWREIAVEESAAHGSMLVARFAGSATREDAAAFRNRDVAVPRETLPEAGEGEIYWVDLVGLEVSNTEGESLGRVDSLMDNGAQSILVVKGEKEHLIPFVDQYVRQVDTAGGRILVDWGRDY